MIAVCSPTICAGYAGCSKPTPTSLLAFALTPSSAYQKLGVNSSYFVIGNTVGLRDSFLRSLVVTAKMDCNHAICAGFCREIRILPVAGRSTPHPGACTRRATPATRNGLSWDDHIVHRSGPPRCDRRPRTWPAIGPGTSDLRPGLVRYTPARARPARRAVAVVPAAASHISLRRDRQIPPPIRRIRRSGGSGAVQTAGTIGSRLKGGGV